MMPPVRSISGARAAGPYARPPALQQTPKLHQAQSLLAKVLNRPMLNPQRQGPVFTPKPKGPSSISLQVAKGSAEFHGRSQGKGAPPNPITPKVVQGSAFYTRSLGEQDVNRTLFGVSDPGPNSSVRPVQLTPNQKPIPPTTPTPQPPLPLRVVPGPRQSWFAAKATSASPAPSASSASSAATAFPQATQPQMPTLINQGPGTRSSTDKVV